MDWTQFATFLIANIVFTLTLWLWNRSESRNDLRKSEEKIEDNRRETNMLIKSFELEMRGVILSIHDETKDFHGRLCAIEERNRGK